MHENERRKERELRKDTLTVLVWGIAVLVVLIVVFIYFRTRKTTIELDGYLTISFEGYDTRGTAKAVFDTDSFVTDYKDSLRYKGGQANTRAGSYENAAAALLGECVSGSLDKSDHLSNGDTVTWVWEIDEEKAEQDFNVKFQYSNKEQEVEGLPEAETFDPFDNIDVVFDGTVPFGTVTIQQRSSTGMYAGISYRSDKSDGLSNWETVTVYAEASDGGNLGDELLDGYGKLPSVTEKTYTVSGLIQYIEKISEIPENSMDAMKAQTMAHFRTATATLFKADLPLSAVSYMGSYLLTRKISSSDTDMQESSEGETDVGISEEMTADAGSWAGFFGQDEEWQGSLPHNLIYLVYKVHIDEDGWEEPVTYYYYTGFRDLYFDRDGSFQVDLEDYAAPDGFSFLGFNSGDVVSFTREGRTYTFVGYETLEELWQACGSSRLDDYDYDTTMTEGPVRS